MKKDKKSEDKGDFEDAESQAFAGQNLLLFGKVPEEFSPRRMMAAQALGFRFFKLNAAERAQLNDTNYVYDGMFWDATLCAYLCSCPVSVLFKAMRVPEATSDLIMKWADEQNLHAGSSGFKEVMNHYNAVMEHIVRSSAEQVTTQDRKPGNADGGLPGE